MTGNTSDTAKVSGFDINAKFLVSDPRELGIRQVLFHNIPATGKAATAGFRRAGAVLMAAESGELTPALSDPRWSAVLVHLCRG